MNTQLLIPAPGLGKVLRRTLPLACTCIFLLLSVGCQSSAFPVSVPVSFESLCGLTPEQFAAMDRDDAWAWVRQKQESVGPYAETKWHIDLQQGHLLSIRVSEVTDGPTFGQIVDSLGPPNRAYVSAVSYENTVYTIGLDYPTAGISVSGGGWGWGYIAEVRLTRDMRVENIQCYAPRSSMEEVLREVYLAPEETVRDGLANRIPWPGFGAMVSLERR